MALIARLLADRGVDVPVSWLCREFDIRTLGGEVLIPHWSPNGLQAMKKRTPPTWESRAVTA